MLVFLVFLVFLALINVLVHVVIWGGKNLGNKFTELALRTVKHLSPIIQSSVKIFDIIHFWVYKSQRFAFEELC